MAENNTNISPQFQRPEVPHPGVSRAVCPLQGLWLNPSFVSFSFRWLQVFCDLRPQDTRIPIPGPQSTVRVNEALFRFMMLKHHRITVFSFRLRELQCGYGFHLKYSSAYFCLYFDFQFSPLFVDLIYSYRVYKISAQFYTIPCILRRLNLSSQLFLPFHCIPIPCLSLQVTNIINLSSTFPSLVYKFQMHVFSYFPSFLIQKVAYYTLFHFAFSLLEVMLQQPQR